MTDPARHTAAAAEGAARVVRRFAARYGWRAYALPVLLTITVTSVLQMSRPGRARLGAGERASNAARGSGSMTSQAGAAGTVASIEIVSDRSASTACLTNNAASLVLVSLSRQHAWMCQQRMQVNSSPVTTGAVSAGDSTPTGSWLLENKQTDRYLSGPGYRDFVRYWIPFDGDVGFHDASWQRTPYGSPDYRSAGSHGCVHLPLSVARWLYGWARTGSTVVTIVN